MTTESIGEKLLRWLLALLSDPAQHTDWLALSAAGSVIAVLLVTLGLLLLR